MTFRRSKPWRRISAFSWDGKRIMKLGRNAVNDGLSLVIERLMKLRNNSTTLMDRILSSPWEQGQVISWLGREVRISNLLREMCLKTVTQLSSLVLSHFLLLGKADQESVKHLLSLSKRHQQVCDVGQDWPLIASPNLWVMFIWQVNVNSQRFATYGLVVCQK